MAYRVVPDRQGVINIGKIKENLVTEVELPAPGFGGGSYAVLLRRPKEEQPYPVTARHEGSTLVWMVRTSDTAIAGTGKLECRWYGDNGEVAKSQTYMVRITDGLPDPTEAPEAWEGFMGQVARDAQAAQTAAGEAKANADGAAASAGIAQGAATKAGKLAGAAGEAANAAAAAASAASSAQAGSESAERNARAAAEAAETARNGAEAAKLAARDSATGAAGSAETAAQAAQKGQALYDQIKADLAAGKLKGEKGDKGDPGAQGPQGEQGPAGPAGKDGLDAPQIDDAVVSTENPWSSQKIVETLCPPLDVRGNPVTCEPVAGYPLGVVASWAPTQAGEGEPYPAGGGKNLIPYPSNIGYSFPMTRNGLTITSNPDGSYTVNGTATANTYFAVCYLSGGEFDNIGTVTLSGCPKGGNTAATNGYYLALYTGVGGIWKSDVGSGVSIDLGALGGGARIEITVTSGCTVNNLKFCPQLEKGSTATAYAPYENIRPISGRYAVSVERCGANIAKAEPIVTTTSNSAYWNLGTKVKVLPGVHYYVSYKVQTTAEPFNCSCGLGTYSGIIYFDIPNAYKGNQKNGIIWFDFQVANDFIAKIPEDNRYLGIRPNRYNVATKHTTTVSEICVSIIDDTAYTPYRGDTLALALPSTVYGGTVDAVTGEGAETWKLVTLDGNWEIGRYREAEDTDTYKGFVVINAAAGIDISRDAVCSHFKRGMATSEGYHPNEFVAHHPAGHLYLRTEIPGVTSVETFKAYLAAQYAAGTPVQIAYRLAEPVPFRATGNGPLLPIPGEANTVMTDADSVSVTGRADLIRIIQQLQAAQSASTAQLDETQQAVVDTTAMAVDYIYEQDSKIFGGDDDDSETDAVPT